MLADAPLPLPALVGLDAAQQALLLLAVEPRLRGVVLAAAAGSGKSSLAHGFRALHDSLPFVELPLHADEDSLLGGLDIEATLRGGVRALRPGLLARADRGVLAIDGLNLLPDASANLLLAALDSGQVCLEREGLSVRHAAQFAVLACYDPAEGAPRRHVLDRIGLLVALPATSAAPQRMEIVRRNLRPGATSWDDELALLRGLTLAAREQRPHVRIDDAQIEQLVRAAVEVGVEGQRAELFAVRAACAAAALDLRDTVDQADLDLALRLVILPRATRLPSQEPPPDPPEASGDQRQSSQAPGAGDASDSPADAGSDEPPQTESSAQPPSTLDEQVLSALATTLPVDLNDLPFRAQRRGRSGSRGSVEGRRGRHIRSVSGDPRRARIDIAATLRTAAPWQRIRRENEEPRTENQEQRNKGTREQGNKGTRNGNADRRPPMIQADDLRVKRFRSKASTLFCFAVDASGSMAVHRMRQAKGAVHALLQQAYVHRDRVALLSFRGAQADLLLPPSQSVELARRALDLLPTGGGTPLGAALLSALTVAAQARSRGVLQTVLVLLTDGRANIGVRGQRGEIAAELQQIARQVAAAGIRTIVVDTQRSYLSRGEARQLAGWLDGAYVYLPNARGEQIADLALAAKERG